MLDACRYHLYLGYEVVGIPGCGAVAMIDDYLWYFQARNSAGKIQPQVFSLLVLHGHVRPVLLPYEWPPRKASAGKMKRAGIANVRNYMIYDFKGRAPRSLYCLRECLESRGLAGWIQYSVDEA